MNIMQSGKSITTAGFLLWYTMFNDAKEVAVLANKLEQSMEIMYRISNMYIELPFWLQLGCESFNKGSIIFENKSKIFGSASSPDAIRGRSLAIMYWDETSTTAQDHEFWASVSPVIESGKTTKIFMSSTPKGARGVFYETYRNSELGVNGFKHICIKWDRVPGRDQEWADSTIKKIGKSCFLQEYNCNFIGSTGTLIPSDILQRLQFSNPINNDQFFQIYEEPIKEHKYIAIVDPAAGLGLDYSVCTVIDVTEIPYKLVAKYRNNEISPMVLPYTINSICRKYNECPVLVESNNDIGGIVVVSLYYDIEYENVILCNSETNKYGVRVGGFSKGYPGIKTTNKVKMQGCSNLKTLIETEKLIINDYDTISELGTFVINGKGYAADEGCHDDCVMPLVLFAYITKLDYFIDYTSTDLQKSLFFDFKPDNKYELLPFKIEQLIEIETQIDGIKVTDGSYMSLEQWMNS